MGYLFGDISIVAEKDLWLIAALDLVVVGVSVVFYRQLQAVCFDEEFARTRGLRVEFYYMLLLCLTALTVVLLVTVVGIVMVIALLTLPVAVAGQWARRLWKIMVLSAAISAALSIAGLAMSYSPGLPAGPTTIILAGATYILALSAGQLVRRRNTP